MLSFATWIFHRALKKRQENRISPYLNRKTRLCLDSLEDRNAPGEATSGLIGPLIGLSFLDPLSGMASVVGENAFFAPLDESDTTLGNINTLPLIDLTSESSDIFSFDPIPLTNTEESFTVLPSNDLNLSELPSYSSLSEDLLDESLNQTDSSAESVTPSLSPTESNSDNQVGSGALSEPPLGLTKSDTSSTGSVTFSIVDGDSENENFTTSSVSGSGGGGSSSGGLIAVNDYSTVGNTSVTIPVLNNDSGYTGISSFTQGSRGSVSQSGSFLVYTPGPNFNQSDTFTYTITNAQGAFSTATVAVKTGGSNPLLAVDDSVSTNEDTSVTVSVLSNDFGHNGTITQTTNPTFGTIGISGSQITYTPDADYFGTDSFTYEITDGQGAFSTATVTVSVIPTELHAVDDYRETNEDTSVTISVLSNDAGHNGTIVSSTNPSHGTKSISGNQVIYTPNLDYFGWDSFDYTITDGQGHFSTATVDVWIEAVGLHAVDDSETTDPNTSVTIDVLNNDIGHNGTIFSNTNPTHGTVTVSIGQMTYTPTLDYTGSDSFTYTITDGQGAYSTATVHLQVEPSIPTVNVEAITPTTLESGSTPAVFRFSRSGSTQADLVVHYEVSGLATNSVDYQTISGAITILAGNSYVDLPISPIDDSIAENTEDVQITLRQTTTYQIGVGSAAVTILDDVNDSTPIVSLSSNDPEAQEPLTQGGSGEDAELIVSRTGPTSNSLTVFLNIQGGATSGVDYTALPVTVVIPAGSSSITLPIHALYDNQQESPETISVTLQSNPNQVYTFSSVTEQIIIILDALAALAQPEANLYEVTFIDQAGRAQKSKYAIQKDPDKDMIAPSMREKHWLDSNKNGTIDEADGEEKERRYPVAYARNASVFSNAKFAVTNPKPFEVQGKKIFVRAVRDLGNNQTQVFFQAKEATLANNVLTVNGISAGTPFADVAYFPDFKLTWQVAVDTAVGQNTVWSDIGQSNNPVYVTYKDPPTSNLNTEWFVSIVHQGSKYGAGAQNEQQLLQKIWAGGVVANQATKRSSFEDRTIERMKGYTEDKGFMPMTYYKNWQALEVKSNTLLRDNDGQCYGWAGYFAQVMRVQGFDYSMGIIRAKNDPQKNKLRNFVVNEWKADPNATAPYVNQITIGKRTPVELQKLANGNTVPIIKDQGNYKYDFIATKTQVTDEAGTAGQNNTNPASLFNNHVVIKIGTELWDPSYGKIYTSLDDFQKKAIFGYYQVEYRAAQNELRMNNTPMDPNKLELTIANYTPKKP